MTTPALTTFYWKQHDTAPVIQSGLTDASGNPINLTGASVTFIMCAANTIGTPKINAAGTIVNAVSGVVQYQPTGTDTNTAGTFDAEWQIIYSGGAKQTFPDPGYLTVIITADLDNA